MAWKKGDGAVNLSVHKSKIEKSRTREVRRDMVSDARAMGSRKNIVAYAMVAFSDDGRCFVTWETGGVLPMWAFPATVREALAHDMATCDAAEDFKKPLLDRAWKGSK